MEHMEFRIECDDTTSSFSVDLPQITPEEFGYLIRNMDSALEGGWLLFLCRTIISELENDQEPWSRSVDTLYHSLRAITQPEKTNAPATPTDQNEVTPQGSDGTPGPEATR